MGFIIGDLRLKSNARSPFLLYFKGCFARAGARIKILRQKGNSLSIVHFTESPKSEDNPLMAKLPSISHLEKMQSQVPETPQKNNLR